MESSDIIFLIKILNQRCLQHFGQTFINVGLTGEQCRILDYICEADRPLYARDLETLFNKSRPTISGILARLEEKEYLYVEVDQKDNRYKRLVPAPKAYKLHNRIQQAFQSLHETVLEGLNEQQQHELRLMLMRMIQNIEKEESSC